MGFETGTPDRNYAPDPPDFQGGIKTYTEMVAQIGVMIKERQAELAVIENQIAQAIVDRTTAYGMKIASSEQMIKDLETNISTLIAQRDQLDVDIGVKQAIHDSIDTSLTSERHRIEQSWADFHMQANQLTIDMTKLKDAQASFDAYVKDANANKTVWENAKIGQQAQIDQKLGAAQEALDEGTTMLALAQDNTNKANALVVDADQKQKDLLAKIDAAQPILAQADAIAKQKAQNDEEAKNNALQAVQNQNDANQIKVARIALNNLQQDYNSRMQTLQQAEAALKGG